MLCGRALNRRPWTIFLVASLKSWQEEHIEINNSLYNDVNYYLHLNRNTAAFLYYNRCLRLNYRTFHGFPQK